MTETNTEFEPGVGLDIGTGFVVCARMSKSGELVTKSIRDCFLEIKPQNRLILSAMKKSLLKAGINFFEDSESLIILGQDSLNQSIERNVILQRPMAKGVISPTEAKALPMFKALLKELLGPPQVENEKVVFTVPAAPIDASFDVIYHTAVIESILNDLGYKGSPLNEAHAIGFSELENEDYTGITISCLHPDQRIITYSGIKKIINVNAGDLVLSGRGTFEKVYSVVGQNFSGDMYEIKLRGYSEPIKITYNHKVRVYDNGEWIWKEAKNLKIGDVLASPSPAIKTQLKTNTKRYNKRNTIYLSKDKFNKKKSIELSRDMAIFLGAFLGDGSSKSSRGYEVYFTLNKTERVLAEELRRIGKKFLKKEGRIIDRGNNSIRLIFESGRLTNWLNTYCYNKDLTKKFPFDVSTLNINQISGFLYGLIMTDGSITLHENGTKTIGFTTTSTSLSASFFLLLNRLSINPILTVRPPRTTFLKDGRAIQGNRETFEFSINGIQADILNTYLFSRNIKAKLFNGNGMNFTTISNIKKYEYNGSVIDIGIENEPSFCAPYITLHNCGSGMTNIGILNVADLVCKFSVAKGGDYIDLGTAQSLGFDLSSNTNVITPNLVTYVKENGVDILNPDPTDKIQIGIAAHYKNLIKYVLENTIKTISKEPNMPKFLKPIPIIVSGGTSLATNFITVFNQELEQVKSKLPFTIKEVRHSGKSLSCVAEGCLLALLAEDN